MKILFINSNGGGFADYLEVAPGTTAVQHFEERLLKRRPDEYLLRVNRLPVSSDQILKGGDRVSMTPTKIEGAT